MEPKVIECTVCGKKMKIPPTHFGKKIKCPGCEAVLVIGAEGNLSKAIPAGGAPAKPAAAAAGAGGKPATKAPAASKTPSKPAAAAGGDKTASAKAAAAAAAGAKPTAAKGESAAKAAVATKADPKGKAASADKGEEKKAVATKPELKTNVQQRKPGLTPVAVNKVEKGVKAGVKAAKFGRSAGDRVKLLDRDKEQSQLWTMVVGIFLVIGLGGTGLFIFLTDPGEPKEPEAKLRVERDVALRPGDKVSVGEQQIQVYVRSTDNMEFVKIPAGTYKVGLASDEIANEGPQVEVTVGEYYIGRNEVSVAEYNNFLQFLADMRQTKGIFDKEAELHAIRNPAYSERMRKKADEWNEAIFDHPLQPPSKTSHAPRVSGIQNTAAAVTEIDWFDAYAYANWANAGRPELGILPSEVEWEIAARGPGNHIYPWGETEAALRRLVANTDETEPGISDAERQARMNRIRLVTTDDIQKKVAEFGWFESKVDRGGMWNNGFGLLNIAGNAAEWCWDRYAERLYPYLGQHSGHIAFQPELTEANFQQFHAAADLRAVRTNSIQSFRDQAPSQVRYTTRLGMPPMQRSADIGFRCVYYENGQPGYRGELEAVQGAGQEVAAMRPAVRKAYDEAAAAKRAEVQAAEAAKGPTERKMHPDDINDLVRNAGDTAARAVEAEMRAQFKERGHLWFETFSEE